MKTNFFEQVAGLAIAGNLQINIHNGENGKQTVSLMMTGGNPKTGAGKNLPPMLLKGSPQELDEGFFLQIAEPVKQTNILFANLEAYQKELDKARKEGKGKEVKSGREEESEAEENNLFQPKADDRETKAEKKRLYDEAMQKVKDLNTQMKYAEAMAQLPDAEEYPDKAGEINGKAEELRKRQQLYASLQEEV